MTASVLLRTLLVAAVLLAAPTVSLACSCLDYRQTAAAYKASGLVVAGRVMAAETIRLPQVVYSRNAAGELVSQQVVVQRGLYTVQVSQSWKGEGTTIQVLAGEPEPAGDLVIVDCDIHLRIGKDYLLFVSEGYADVDPCAPSGPLERAGRTRAELDALLKARGRGVASSR